MAIFEVPLQAIPSQTVVIVLDGQPYVVGLRELGGRQYFSLSVNGSVICENVLISNNSRIVNAPYTGFRGDFASIDLVGDEPPNYTGWGDRWRLAFSNEN